MEKPKNSSELKQFILSKEIEQANDNKVIKEQYQLTRDSLTQTNLIDLVLTKVKVPSEIKAETIKVIAGMIGEFIANKMLEKKEKQSESELITSLVKISISQSSSNKTEEEKLLEHLMLKQTLYQYVISTQKDD